MTVFHTTLKGTIAAGTVGEIFSHSLGIQSSESAQTVANAVRDAWQTAWRSGAPTLEAQTPDDVVYTEATAAVVLDPMVPDLGAAAHAPFSGGLAGTSVGGMLPSQIACAVSLTAGQRPDGRPFRGRFFLPPLANTVCDAQGQLSAGIATVIADAMKVFMDTLFAGAHWPSVWSRTTEDLVNYVTEVRVGNRLDTIRSRRNALPEVYQSRTPVGPQ
jgi:hypothetical protein